MSGDDTDTPARLRVVGQHLVKANGRPLWLRGVNWGTWGENVESDADEMVAVGANCVRVSALRWWGLYGGADTDARDNDAYSFIRRANLERALRELRWLAERELWIVLFIDSNCGQSGTQNPDMQAYCDPYGTFDLVGRNFLTDHPMRQLFKVVWKTVAGITRYVPRIAAYELTPEPLDGRGTEWAGPLRDYYRELIDAVLEVDSSTPFLLGARGAYDAAFCDEAWLSERTDCLYTGNLLSGKVTNPPAFDKALDAMLAMREERNVPILAQQVGRKSGNDRDLAFMRRALERLSAARVHFTWWQNKQNTTNPDEYALHYKDGHGGWVAKQNEINLLSSFLKEHA